MGLARPGGSPHLTLLQPLLALPHTCHALSLAAPIYISGCPLTHRKQIAMPRGPRKKTIRYVRNSGEEVLPEDEGVATVLVGRAGERDTVYLSPRKLVDPGVVFAAVPIPPPELCQPVSESSRESTNTMPTILDDTPIDFESITPSAAPPLPHTTLEPKKSGSQRDAPGGQKKKIAKANNTIVSANVYILPVVLALIVATRRHINICLSSLTTGPSDC